MGKTTGVGAAIMGVGLVMLQQGDTGWWVGALIILLGAGVMTLRATLGKAIDRLPPVPPAAAIVALLLLVGCTTTNYNIDFHEGAFRVADKMKIDPGQGGDDGSSTTSAPTSGGEEGSPGGSNLLRGYAQQGNIFQIGTAAKSDGEVKATATVQSPNSQTGTGDEVANTQPVAEPVE